MQSPPKPQTQSGPSALAIATFILGLLAFPTGGLTGIAAIITGIIEFFNIHTGRSSRAGYVLNLVGFGIACAVLLFLVVFGVAVLSFFRPWIEEIQRTVSGMAPRK